MTRIGAQASGGEFESVAFDNRSALHFFVTEDRYDGALRRFSPYNWQDGPSSILEEGGGGTTHWLVLSDVQPTEQGGVSTATFAFTTDEAAARRSQEAYYPHTEGIDFRPNVCTRRGCFGELYFTSKVKKALITLFVNASHPDRGVAQISSTAGGAFENEPDQIEALVGRDDLLYFCEDGGHNNGVHARDGSGKFYTILSGCHASGCLVGDVIAETTGLAFSPDKRAMYVSYQGARPRDVPKALGGECADDICSPTRCAGCIPGQIFEVRRSDGLPFGGATLDIKYHESSS